MLLDYNEYINMNTNDREAVLRDSIRNYRTMSLFEEYKHPDYASIWTLRPYDYKAKEGVYPSLRKIYMDLKDPTEGRIATEVFTTYELWNRIANSAWFKPYITQWRNELEIRLRAEGLSKLIEQSGRSTSAAQFLAEGKWKQKRGRPTKEEVEGERKIQAGIVTEVDELFSRATQGNA